MYAFGYVFVAVIGAAFVLFALQGVEKTRKKMVALGMTAYGLFGLPYGASVGSNLTMFVAAVMTVLGLECYLREWKEEISKQICEEITARMKSTEEE